MPSQRARRAQHLDHPHAHRAYALLARIDANNTARRVVTPPTGSWPAIESLSVQTMNPANSLPRTAWDSPDSSLNETVALAPALTAPVIETVGTGLRNGEIGTNTPVTVGPFLGKGHHIHLHHPLPGSDYRLRATHERDNSFKLFATAVLRESPEVTLAQLAPSAPAPAPAPGAPGAAKAAPGGAGRPAPGTIGAGRTRPDLGRGAVSGAGGPAGGPGAGGTLPDGTPIPPDSVLVQANNAAPLWFILRCDGPIYKEVLLGNDPTDIHGQIWWLWRCRGKLRGAVHL